MAAILIGGLLGGAGARCAELIEELKTPHNDWSVFAGATYTDNATLTPNGPDDTIATAGLAVSLFQSVPRIRASLDGSLYYTDYLHHTYKSDVFGGVSGSAALFIVPERFSWYLDDVYGQVTANALAPSTPGNRVNANTFATGPDLSIPLGQTIELTAAGRYEETNFGHNQYLLSNFDDHRLQGRLGLDGHPSQASTVGLEADYSRVEYQAASSAFYDQSDLYLEYIARLTRGGVELQAGATRIKQFGAEETSPLIRITAYRQILPSWSLNFGASREFGNATDIFRAAADSGRVVGGTVVVAPSGPPVGGGTTSDQNLTLSVLRRDELRLSLDFKRPRTQVTFATTYGRERAAEGPSDVDRDFSTVSFVASRVLRPTMEAHLGGGYERRVPQGPTIPGDHTTTADAGLDARMSSTLTMNLSYRHESRSTDLGGIPYRVNYVYLGLSYAPHGRALTQ